jgi:hypothetical protein
MMEGWLMDQARGSSSSAVAIDGHYVQVRYPRGQWVTVVMEKTRATASAAAAAAYRGLLDAEGEVPNQCRIVSAAQLVREGGQRQIRIAAGEIARVGDSKASRRAATP